MMGIENLPNSATAALLHPGLAKAATPASGAAGAAGAFAELLSASLDESANTGIDTGTGTGIDTDTDTAQVLGELAQGADWLLQTLASNQLPPTVPVARATLELGPVKPAPLAATALAGQVLAKAGQRAAVVGPGQGPEGPADGARVIATKTDVTAASAQPEAAQDPPQLGIDLAGGVVKALLPVATPAQSAVARAQRAAKDPAGLKPLTPDALSDWVPRKISNTAEPQAIACR